MVHRSQDARRICRVAGKEQLVSAIIESPALVRNVCRVEPRMHRRERFNERVQDRAEWGYRELKALLSYARREGIDPVAITGSYALRALARGIGTPALWITLAALLAAWVYKLLTWN